VNWLAETNVSAKLVASIFRVQVTLALKMETARFFETLAPSNKSTKRFNPKEHYQNFQHRENFESLNSL
jgi:hypothetical protein